MGLCLMKCMNECLMMLVFYINYILDKTKTLYVMVRGGRGPDWAGFACFTQPAP
jgi:hypothetical protein